MASEKSSTSTKANAKKQNTSKTSAKQSPAKSTKDTQAKGQTTAGKTQSKTQTTGKTQSKNKTTSAKAQSNAPKKGMSSEEYARLHEKERMVKKEVGILAAFAVALFLFFSNFGICGSIGDFFNGLMCGVFGVMGYVFPIYIAGVVIYILLVRGIFKPQFKVAAAIILYWIICGFSELILGGGFDRKLKFLDYYFKGQTDTGGGLAGGIIVKLLVPYLSVAGTVILLIVILLIAVVFISEQSIVEPIGKKGKRAYTSAKEDISRYREGYRQHVREVKDTENRRYFQPDMTADNKEKKKPVENNTFDNKAAESVNKFDKYKFNTPAFTNSSVNTASNDTEPAAFTKEDKKSPFVDYGNTSRMAGVNEFVVTIDSEKEHVIPENAPSDWYLDDLQIDDEVKTAEEIIYGEDVEENSGSYISGEFTFDEDNLLGDIDYPEDVYEDLANTDTGRTEDVRRVVTATGRVIEKEIDPTEDPIAAKRKRGARLDSDYVAEDRTNISAGMENTNNPYSRAPKNKPDKQDVKPELKEIKKPSKPYVKPPIKLLTRQTKTASGMSREDLNATALKLQQTLRDFGVGVTVTDYSCGPAVTRYELQPDHGVKVSRIVSLSDDIKLNLAAADIRIEAPIPGKSVVGIEVPNKENSTVFFRNVIESDDFCNHPSKLAFAVGKDIGGNNVVADLARMPHLLIAGATGSGKSVCINTLIMSILYKSTPEEVQLLMIDPKVVELSVYNGIPHLRFPVVTDPKLASGALNWAVAEMTERYKKFAEYNVRDIKGYNEKVEQSEDEELTKLPQIVIIVDELADLMMVAPGEVEDAICRLAQMARAAGLHLVIATQRPSVNVITGLIKANIPSRIAFSVSSGVDSRTIIDMNGAEKLLGKGDMLFYPSGYQKPIRVQGAFISDNEVSDVVKFLSGNSEPAYESDAADAFSMFSGSSKDSGGAAASGSQYDEYFERAGRFIIEKDKASIGMLQRVFKIGFNRAGRIMDQLAEAGVVGPEEGTKPRKVLMSMEQFENFIEECL